MNDKKIENPFEIRTIEQHEKKEMDKMYKEETPDPTEYIRIGPKGYLVTRKYETMAADIYNMELRPTDIFVASYQRSGTTMTQELVWLIAKDLDFETAKREMLTQRYTFLEFAMFFEKEHVKYVDNEEMRKLWLSFTTPATETLPAISDQRFIKTHLPMSLLPPNILDKTKVIYVARDPRDVIVSSFHHTKLFREIQGYIPDFKHFWNVFRKDLIIQTPYLEHVKEAWSLRHHPNMMFLFYEDIIKDMPTSLHRVAGFLGKKLTQEHVALLCDHLSVENFKKNPAVNLQEFRPMFASGEKFIRSGKSGGWRDYFVDEMVIESQQWIEENLRGTDLVFPSNPM